MPSFARTSPTLTPAKSSASSIPPPPSYPAPLWGRGSPTLGQRGDPQQPGHQNLRRIPRIQSSQIALAKAESARRDKRKSHDACGPVSALQIAAPLATPQEGYPSSEATGDGKGTRLTEEVTAGMSRSDAAGKLMDVNDGGLQAAKLPWSTPTLTEDRQSSMLGTESASDDLRRKAKGAAGDRLREAGGMASDRTIAEEEGEWTL